MTSRRSSRAGEHAEIQKRTRRRQMIWRRPWLYAKQEAFLYAPERYVVVEAATKTGKTYGCIVWLLEQAAMLGGSNKNFWWVAPTYSQAEIAFRRTVSYCPPELIRVNYTKMTVALPNGGMLWFKTAERPDALYGEDVYAVVMDEATRMREAAFVAVRSTLTFTRGKVRIIGNVKGRKNWAYRLARRAENGTKNMKYARLSAYDAAEAGIYPMEEIEDAKATLPPDAFQELYLALPAEDAANPFGLDNIRKCSIPMLGQGAPVAFGVDFGRKVDWTVIVGLNKKGEVCAFDRFQKPWPETEDIVIRITRQTPTLLDATGVGDPPVQHIQLKNRNASGLIYTPATKQDLMVNLAIAVQRQNVHFPELADEDTIGRSNDPRLIVAEMQEFEYEYTSRGQVVYSAPEGLHDDCVNALALAWRQFSGGGHVPIVSPYTEKVYAPFAV